MAVTADEKRQQRAEIQIDLEDTRESLSALQVKANRMAEFLEEIASELRHNASLEPSRRDFALESDLANKLTPQQQAIPDFASIQGLIEELRAVRQKLVNLEQQKAQLGHSSGITIAS